MSEKFQVVVIGGGPAGYVCAIRLAQLGFKTACIESRGSLGGTCLNVGCIPSKNLLNVSENFNKAKNFSKLGIEVGEVKLNLEKMMKNKDKAVTILTKGVEFLLKKNKVTYFKGIGSFKSKNEIIIKDDQNKESIIESRNFNRLFCFKDSTICAEIATQDNQFEPLTSSVCNNLCWKVRVDMPLR